MRCLSFAKRNTKEIIRDPLSLIFAVILPLFLLILFQQMNIPNEAYNIENFAPGIIIFGFSFISLFTATLVSKDRSTSLLSRLLVSPMTSGDYIIGYAISVLPIVLIQNVLFLTVSVMLGLEFGIRIIFVVLFSIVISVLFIMLGILVGCITNEKSSSAICSLIVQLVAFTSGMYFSNEMLGKVFVGICDALPFSHCLKIVKSLFNGNLNEAVVSVAVFIVYTLIIGITAIIVFKRKKDK